MDGLEKVTRLLQVVLPFLAVCLPILMDLRKRHLRKRQVRRRRPDRGPVAGEPGADQSALPRGPRPWLGTLGLSIASGLIVYGLTYSLSRLVVASVFSPHITILQPSQDSIIGCQSTSPDGYCIYKVEGKISRPLRPDHKLYVFIKESGGDEWWVSGGAIQQQAIVDGRWSQPWASFGNQYSPVKDYLVCALVTTDEYKSGQKFGTLPGSIVVSDTVAVHRQ
jgi:hypothetical protein